MKKLLVGSIFAPDPRNETWLRLQLQFLEETVGDFDHVVFLNRVDPQLFGDSFVLGSVPTTELWATDELTKAMDALMRHFASQPGYENYLMIDSDAFPVRRGWIDDLEKLMAERGEFGLVQRTFAAPVRCENMDRFVHGCAFFAKGEWFRRQNSDRYSWEYMPGTNFMGAAVKDVTLRYADAIADETGAQVWLPLLRTNRVNYHPIMGAIYGDVFYHHGAGSRAPQFRAIMHGAYDNFSNQEFTERRNVEMFSALQRDPHRYLQVLLEDQKISRKFRLW